MRIENTVIASYDATKQRKTKKNSNKNVRKEFTAELFTAEGVIYYSRRTSGRRT